MSRSTFFTRRRIARAVASAACVVILLLGGGCGDDAETGFDFGRVVFDGPVLAVPDFNWSLDEAGGWTFRGSATIHFLIAERPDSLELVFEPTGEAAEYRYRVLWNDQPIAGPFAGEGEPLVAAVPEEHLEPGRHVLEIERVYGGRRTAHDNPLKTLGYRLDGEQRLFAPERLEHARYLGDFVLLGVTGIGRQKYGGLLFDGPRASEAVIELDGPGHLHLRGENFSTAEARFELRVGDEEHTLEVPAMSDAPWRLPLAAGRHELELRVEGARDGLFLWGEPVVEPGRPAGGESTAITGEPATPIFLITLDTTRRDALSPYGEDPEITPVLDDFARRASVYERAYSVAPWTLPSHASMMTGLYPSRHGAGVSAQYLSAGFPTLASVLRRRGYFTAGFAGGRLASHRYGIGQGFHRFRNPEQFEIAGDEMTADLERFLGRHARKDLFVFANYFDPHAMYQAPDEFAARVDLEAHRAALDGHPVWQRFDRGDPGAWRQIIDLEATSPPEVLDYMRAAYLSEVAFMDAQLGRLFELLRRLDLYDRALIVLVADHGELLGEHGLFSHAGRLDPELTEIPLLIKWPGQSEGRRVDSLVSHVDLFATVLAVAGVETPPEHDGVPLAAADGGAEVDPDRRVLFLEEHESRVHPLPVSLKIAPHVYGVQRPEHRQTVWKGGGECAARAAGGGWVPLSCEVSSEAVLDRVLERLGEPGRIRTPGQLSEEEQEALRALGYL